MMEIFRILDELEFLLKEGKKMPFAGGKYLVDVNRCLDRLDRVRAILPEELEQARSILTEKDKIYNEACAQAEEYVQQSKSRIAQMVDDNEITKNAMGIAEEIVVKAEETAAQIRRDADEYADGVLKHMEMVLKKGLETVIQGREDLAQPYRSEY